MRKILALLRLALPFLFWWLPKEKKEEKKPSPSLPLPQDTGALEAALERAKDTRDELNQIEDRQSARKEEVLAQEVHRATPGLADAGGLDSLDLLDPWPEPGQVVRDEP